jgi:hypothetical protein
MSILENYRRNLILAFIIFDPNDEFERMDLVDGTFSILNSNLGKDLLKKSWSEMVSKYTNKYFSNFLKEKRSDSNKSKVYYKRNLSEIIMAMFLVESKNEIFYGFNDTWIISVMNDFNLVAGGDLNENVAFLTTRSNGYQQECENGEEYVEKVNKKKTSKFWKNHPLKKIFKQLFNEELKTGEIGSLESFLEKYQLLMEYSNIDIISNFTSLIALMLWEKFRLSKDKKDENLILNHIILRIATNYSKKPGWLSLDEPSKDISLSEHIQKMKLIKKIGLNLKFENFNKEFIVKFENLPNEAKTHFQRYFEDKYQKRNKIQKNQAIKEFQDRIISDLSHIEKLQKKIECKNEIIKNLKPKGFDETEFMTPTLRYDIVSPILIEKGLDYLSENFREELKKFASLIIHEEIRCHSCNHPLKNINLGCYDHEGGLLLNKGKPRQWVIVQCNYCGDSYSYNEMHESRKNGKIKVFSDEEFENFILNDNVNTFNLKIEESDLEYHNLRLNDLHSYFKNKFE